MIPQYTKRAITIGSDLVRGISIGCPEFVCALIAVLVSSGNIQIISELCDRTSSLQSRAKSSHLPKYLGMHLAITLPFLALWLSPLTHVGSVVGTPATHLVTPSPPCRRACSTTNESNRCKNLTAFDAYTDTSQPLLSHKTSCGDDGFCANAVSGAKQAYTSRWTGRMWRWEQRKRTSHE